MQPKGDKSPLKRTYKETKETLSEHEKPTTPALDTARDGIKKAKIEPNQLQPEAALRHAFTQVAGKVQKELREETEARSLQKDDHNKYREQAKELADFTRSRMIDNTNKVKSLLDNNPNLLEQSKKNNHDRIKYYLELGADNPVASGYTDKKGIMKYYQLKLEQIALNKGIGGSSIGMKEANGEYATKIYEAGGKDWDNKATSHMEKWDGYGKSLKNSEPTNNQHLEVFDHRIKSVSLKIGFCINEHLIKNMNEEQKHENQETFNHAREQLSELTNVLKMDTTHIDTTIRETGHKYAQARGRSDVNIDIDKMVSLASSHKSQSTEDSHIGQSKASSSTDINITFGAPSTVKDELDFDI